tara:strand:+ start:6436 stop:8781 length:2346 start_codon:yes stop_codon:yes gene_type:complete
MQKTNNINNQAKSYLAKLLATENISVEHKKVQTAYFDVKSRLLVLPIWKHMNEDITDLLIAHEVGHALFTPQSGWEKSVIEKKIPKSFLNVIEDARIEKLIKRKYPGLSQSFIKGYRDLIRNDFFGTKNKDINELLLIDRLNIHFKSSHVESPVIFKDEYEQDVVSRMNKLETFDDVVKLAEELSKYCKKESEEKEQEMESLTSDNGDYDGEEDDEMRDGDDSSDDNQDDNEEEENNSSNDSAEDGDEEENQEQEENANTDEPPSGEQSDKELKGAAAKPSDVPEEVSAETDQSWESKKGDLLDPKSKNNDYMNIHNFKNTKDYVVDYKQVLQDFNEVMKPNPDRPKKSESILRLVSEYRKFTKQQSKKVSYMVKEYEMKKAAAAYSRTKQDKSGVIDPLKLHSYKYNDDIFKRMAITPNGKNHGMMMFIDWSGSMHDKITNTIHQLMNLTMFCKKVNIPFEVYAFGNDGYKNRQENRLPKYQEGDITIDNRFNLFNYLSSRMNAQEYEKGMINLFMLAEKNNPKYSISRKAYRTMNWDEIEKIRSQWDWVGNLPREPWGYGMCSTPLNDAIMASIPMVAAFRKKYGIDKMNTVFLTDGSSDGNYDKVTSQRPDRYCSEIGNGFYRVSPNWDSNLVLRDTITKKEYFDVGRRELSESLLDALRQRTGTKVLGFYISSGKKIDRYTLDHYFPDYAYEKGQKIYDRKKVMADYRKNKCLIVKDNIGYDEFYLLAGGEMQISDGQMATPSENAKKSELKRLFTSTLKSSRDSRIVLNKFIEQVA